MSLPPHREKDAKVEGRDPLETAPKQTMAPFKRLMGRLLKVLPDEVAEQQRIYDETPIVKKDAILGAKNSRKMMPSLTDNAGGKALRRP